MTLLDPTLFQRQEKLNVDGILTASNTNFEVANIGNIKISDNIITLIDGSIFDEIILKANRLIEEDSNKIHIFGAENRLYVHHKLSSLGLKVLFIKFWLLMKQINYQKFHMNHF